MAAALPGTEEALSKGAPWLRPSGHSPPGSVGGPPPSGLPRILTAETLQEYLKVVMALQYEEKPPYSTLRNNLEALLQDLRVSAYDPLDLQVVL